MKMAYLRMACFALACSAAPVLLPGCFATRNDLTPIRSDISVLEKQFMDLQREYAKAKYQPDEGAKPGRLADHAPDTGRRLSDIERRLDALESQVRELKQSQSALRPEPMAPEPMAPEPVVVEPIEEKADAPAHGPQAPGNPQ
jgi:hypothetical protein